MYKKRCFRDSVSGHNTGVNEDRATKRSLGEVIWLQLVCFQRKRKCKEQNEILYYVITKFSQSYHCV